MTLTDQQVIDIVNALLDKESIRHGDRLIQLAAALPALHPVIEHYLTITGIPIMSFPRMCQVEHQHWEGTMICGNPLPCPRHGGQ